MDDIGTRLCSIRKEKNMTQYEFAMLLGMKRDAYARYAINASVPTVRGLYTMAKVLNVSADYLLVLSLLFKNEKVRSRNHAPKNAVSLIVATQFHI